ncbi:MAG: tRNA pseudouridine(55) synthase TruB [Psittacicella sp.]
MFKNINGYILLNKGYDISSNKALQKVRRLFNAKKAGHTGALDPLATGMLPICFGEGTKYSSYLLDSDKTYRVRAKLGEKTSTADAEGEILESSSLVPSQEGVRLALFSFLGESKQIPSMFSALKYNGKPLYKYAREGIEVERKARDIKISFIENFDYEYPFVSFDIKVSKGTYIRNLVEDFGDKLKTYAFVKDLHRLSVDPFEASMMITFEELEVMSEDELNSRLYNIESMLKFDSKVLSQEELVEISYGRRISSGLIDLLDGSFIQLKTPSNEFIGLGVLEDGFIYPKKMFSNISSYI